MLLAVVILGLGQVHAAEKVTYYHLDALGSPIAATDENGNLAWKEAYKPYGERIRKEDGGSNSQWYTGKQEDEDNGLTYFGARWYDPTIGRFMGVDPAAVDPEDPRTFNRFAYAANNPYKYVDPDGNLFFVPFIAFIAKEIASEAFERATGIPTGVKGLAKKGFKVLAKKGGGQSVDPNTIRFSQKSVNGTADIVDSMKAKGWKGDAIDVVRMKDGGLTTLDNTRVLAGSRAGINVQANIRNASDPLPSNLVERFTTRQGKPSTWGDAVQNRIGKQGAAFRNRYTNGSPFTGSKD